MKNVELLKVESTGYCGYLEVSANFHGKFKTDCNYVIAFYIRDRC